MVPNILRSVLLSLESSDDIESLIPSLQECLESSALSQRQPELVAQILLILIRLQVESWLTKAKAEPEQEQIPHSLLSELIGNLERSLDLTLDEVSRHWLAKISWNVSIQTSQHRERFRLLTCMARLVSPDSHETLFNCRILQIASLIALGSSSAQGLTQEDEDRASLTVRDCDRLLALPHLNLRDVGDRKRILLIYKVKLILLTDPDIPILMRLVESAMADPDLDANTFLIVFAAVQSVKGPESPKLKLLCLKYAIVKFMQTGTGAPQQVIAIFALLLSQCLEIRAASDAEEVAHELLKYLPNVPPELIPQNKVAKMLVELWNTGNS